MTHTTSRLNPRLKFILPLAAILLSLAARTSSAQTAPASAPAEYKGWVQATETLDRVVCKWNTQSGIVATTVTAAAGNKISFENPLTGELDEYDPATNTITIGLLPPKIYGTGYVLDTPLTLDDLARAIQKTFGENALTVTPSKEPLPSTNPVDKPDPQLERFDLSVSTPPNNQKHFNFVQGSAPSTVLVDPKTKLIRESRRPNDKITFVYGGPDIATIYDAGAPQTAKVIDARPAPDVLAILNRVAARAEKSFPDGLLIKVSMEGASGDATLRLYTHKGPMWAVRQYDATFAEPQKGQVQIPQDWTTAGAEEFLRRLSVTMPEVEEGGDGIKAWGGGFDKETGARTHGATVKDVNGNPKQVELPGLEEFEGDMATAMYIDEGAPLRDIYPDYATGARWSLYARVEKITAADRPGQLGLRTDLGAPRIRNLAANQTVIEEWIDPAHDDHAVEFIFANYDAQTHAIKAKSSQIFSDYALFPAPDGRSYPTVWRRMAISIDGKNPAKLVNKTMIHFFPGRAMPEVPVKATANKP